MVDKNKIAIVTTVSNWILYKKTVSFFPKNIQIFAIDGTKNFYGLRSLIFFIEKLKKSNLDWIIMADEDVVFTNSKNVFNLIEYLKTNNFTVCGMRDGGTLQWRNKNPYVINSFFAILHMSEIHEIYNRKEVLENQYIGKNEFSENIEEVIYKNYNVNSYSESYYCFFLWLLRRGKKTKFLEAFNPYKDDFATTVVLDHEGNEFLEHTWYARFYNKDEFHTKRINKILEKGKKYGHTSVKPIILIDRFHHFKFFFYKYYRRIRRKVKK